MSDPLRLARNKMRALGFDIVRYPARRREPLTTFLDHFDIDTVLDVGANIGQYGHALRHLHRFRGKITSFEPNPRAYEQLVSTITSDGNWEAENIGFADVEGKRDLNVSELSVFSSFLRTTPFTEELDTRLTHTHAESVNVTTLDKWWRVHRPAGRILLKLDTQGFERPILAGAQKSLEHVAGLQVELSLSPLYIDQPLIEDLLPLLRSSGFIPFEFWDGFKDERSGAVLELEALFYRDQVSADLPLNG